LTIKKKGLEKKGGQEKLDYRVLGESMAQNKEEKKKEHSPGENGRGGNRGKHPDHTASQARVCRSAGKRKKKKKSNWGGKRKASTPNGTAKGRGQKPNLELD